MEHLIARIYTHLLKNNIHAEFHTNIDRIFIKNNPQAMGIELLYNRYKPALDREIDSLDYVRRSEITQLINEQDHVRDTIYRGLVDTVEAALHHFNPVHVSAARMIDNVIKSYGNISKMALDAESAAIADLIRELEQPALAQDVTRIGLTPWKDKLKDENDKFRQLMVDRNDETQGKSPYKMKDTRKETDKYYHLIINRIETEHYAGIPVSEDFIREINILIERYKHILAQEQGEHKPKPGPLE
jgi:hypothetical protein